MKCRNSNWVVAIFIIATCPSAAYAYVDPGLLGALWQILYVFAFGFISLCFVKPLSYLKNLFRKDKEKENPSTDEQN